VRIEGTTVTLRPLTEAEVEPVVRTTMPWVTDGSDEAKVREAVRGRIRGDIPFPAIEFAIEAGGRLVGDVQARRDGLPFGVFEIGIGLFDEVDRGRGLGGEALRLITAHLFADGFVHRVQLSTEVTNAPMRRCAEAAGYRFEGVMRGFWTPRGDEPAADYAMYAMTRDDHDHTHTHDHAGAG
jgi:RimJ/RimL family protein N-acetyltransferase